MQSDGGKTLSEVIRKRQIVIDIDDFRVEPFEKADVRYFENELTKMLLDYDVQITKVEVRDVNEV